MGICGSGLIALLAELFITGVIDRSGHLNRSLGIKRVREDAQKELEAMTGRPVHLFLFVKVRENWIDDPARYRDLGLDFKA